METKMNTRQLLPIAAITFLSGCTNLAHHESQPKAISYDDASAFERSHLAHESIPSKLEKIYTQPINKKIPCKLPTTQDQLDRPNFRAYWDGDCKNGFAFGLGRDISISDTHHVDEIIIHDGTGDDWSQPRVDYDYVNSAVSYTVGGSKFPAMTGLIEKMDNSGVYFNQHHTLAVRDESGKEFVILTSEFNPQRIYINGRADRSFAFKFTDNSSAPVLNQNAVSFTAELVEPKTNIVGGVAIVRYANGVVRHFKIVNGRPEPTVLPSDYIDHLANKYQEIQNATAQANTVLQQAKQIEREYLFKACNGKSSIPKLDKKTYTEICTWRDQFKEPYAAALSNYQKQLESMRRQAANVEQQNKINQEAALQQQNDYLREQQINQINAQLQQIGQQMQNAGAQQQQIINSYQAPQVIPITPIGGNRVNCVNSGIVTNCKY